MKNLGEKGLRLRGQSVGKLSRTKGHDFERSIAAKLREIFPDARRQLEYHESDAKGVDIQGTGIWCFQCKRGRKAHPISGIKEIDLTHFPDGKPVLVTKGDNDETYAVIRFTDFLDLLKASSNI